MRRNGIATMLAVLALAGCGDGTPEAAPVESVEEAVFQGGIAQNVECEPAGEFEVRGKERTVFRCSFEEEKEMSGAMRAVNECYVLEGGMLVDVTRELPPGTDCSVSSS